MNQNVSSGARRRQRMGRPPKIDLQQLIQAAIRLGLEDFTIASLAQELGTGVAAIYRLVDSRDELLLLAAEHLSQGLRLPIDCGQSWQEYLREYSGALYHTLVGGENLLLRYLEGGLGPEFSLPSAEAVIAALVRRGLAPEVAIRILHGASALVIGAAATQTHYDRARERGQSHADRTRSLLMDDKSHFTQMKQLASYYADESRQTDWQEHLSIYLEGFCTRIQSAKDL